MKPPVLDLDYAREPRSGGWIGWLVLIAGLAAVATCSYALVDLTHRATELETRLAMAHRKPASVLQAAQREAQGSRTDETLKYADRVAGQLTLPWEALFRAVEHAGSPAVALLSLEPDAGRRSLRITAEAKDKGAMLGYLERLGADRTLLEVHLQEHEVQSDASRPVRFTVLASWALQTP